jgi:hypothetical protein
MWRGYHINDTSDDHRDQMRNDEASLVRFIGPTARHGTLRRMVVEIVRSVPSLPVLQLAPTLLETQSRLRQLFIYVGQS